LAGYIEAISKEATCDGAEEALDASGDDFREGREEDESDGDPSPENSVVEICSEGT